jgi:hypothetical protein
VGSALTSDVMTGRNVTGPVKRGELDGDVEGPDDEDTDDEPAAVGEFLTDPELLHPASAAAPASTSTARRTERPTFRPTKHQCPKSNQWTLT